MSYQKFTIQAFLSALAQAGMKHRQIVVLDCDTGLFNHSASFAKQFPQRFFTFGHSVSNAFGVAMGMARLGKIPFMFLSCMQLSQIFSQLKSLAVSNLTNVKIVSFSLQHQSVFLPVEDYIQKIPNLNVLNSVSRDELYTALEVLINDFRPTYIQLNNQIPSIKLSNKL